MLLVKIGEYIGFCVYRRILFTMVPRNNEFAGASVDSLVLAKEGRDIPGIAKQ